MENSLLSNDRLEFILKCVEETRELSSSLAEFGVYKGGTAKAMANLAPEKPIHLFDTFKGIPYKGENDRHKPGDFNDTRLDDVTAFMGDSKAIFHVGIFEETCLEASAEKFSVVHIDADQYESTKAGLEFFYPRTQSGGWLIFDDYEWANCPGVKLALEEFLKEKPEKLVRSAKFQAAFQKI